MSHDPPRLEPEPYPEPEFDEVELGPAPCATCGEAGACAYDVEGRPLIHAAENEED